jgi:hypothetical protein
MYCYYLGVRVSVLQLWVGLGSRSLRTADVCEWKAMRISQDVILRTERLGDGQRACLTQVNKFNFQFHNNYKYRVKSSLLTDMNRDYVVRLKLAGIKSVPDYSNSEYTEYNAINHLTPNDL